MNRNFVLLGNSAWRPVVMQLTTEEEKAINALKRVAKKWPESLWLFSGNGTLCVMKKRDGKRAMKMLGGSESVNPAYEIDVINIENDGGDW